jgi:hypothetical protein
MSQSNFSPTWAEVLAAGADEVVRSEAARPDRKNESTDVGVSTLQSAAILTMSIALGLEVQALDHFAFNNALSHYLPMHLSIGSLVTMPVYPLMERHIRKINRNTI